MVSASSKPKGGVERGQGVFCTRESLPELMRGFENAQCESIVSPIGPSIPLPHNAGTEAAVLSHGSHVLSAHVCLTLMEGSVWEKDPLCCAGGAVGTHRTWGCCCRSRRVWCRFYFSSSIGNGTRAVPVSVWLWLGADCAVLWWLRMSKFSLQVFPPPPGTLLGWRRWRNSLLCGISPRARKATQQWDGLG